MGLVEKTLRWEFKIVVNIVCKLNINNKKNNFIKM